MDHANKTHYETVNEIRRFLMSISKQHPKANHCAYTRWIRVLETQYHSWRVVHMKYNEKKEKKKEEHKVSWGTFVLLRHMHFKNFKKQKHTKAACNVCCEYYAMEQAHNKWKGHTDDLTTAEAQAKIREYENACEAQKIHLEHARIEYDLYLVGIKTAKAEYLEDPLNGDTEWCSVDHTWRISIDAKELYQLPQWGASPQNQESYFKRKLSVTPMGVYDEGRDCGHMYFYSQEVGKTNSDHVISVIDKFIEDFGKGEKELVINMDNCAVNKNMYLVGYIILLVNWGYFQTVTLHFLIAEHTKFSPDRMFGWLDMATKHLDIFEVIDLLKPFTDPSSKVTRYSGEVLDIGDKLNKWRA